MDVAKIGAVRRASLELAAPTSNIRPSNTTSPASRSRAPNPLFDGSTHRSVSSERKRRRPGSTLRPVSTSPQHSGGRGEGENQASYLHASYFAADGLDPIYVNDVRAGLMGEEESSYAELPEHLYPQLSPLPLDSSAQYHYGFRSSSATGLVDVLPVEGGNAPNRNVLRRSSAGPALESSGQFHNGCGGEGDSVDTASLLAASYLPSFAAAVAEADGGVTSSETGKSTTDTGTSSFQPSSEPSTCKQEGEACVNNGAPCCGDLDCNSKCGEANDSSTCKAKDYKCPPKD